MKKNKKIISMYDFLKASAEETPFNLAIYYQGRIYNYRQYLKKIDRLASILYYRLNIRKNDVVMVSQPNIPDMLFLIYALNKIGAIVNLVHPFTPYNQICDIIEKTHTKVAFLFEQRIAKEVQKYREISDMIYVTRIEDHLPFFKKIGYHLFMNFRIRKKLGKWRNSFKGFKYLKDLKPISKEVPLSNKNENDISVYLHSGSTTGDPKTICLCDKNFNFIAEHFDEFMCCEKSDYKNKFFLSALPSFHGFGFCVTMHLPLGGNCGIALMPKFNSDEVAKMMNDIKFIAFAGVPTIYEKLINSQTFCKHPGLKFIKACWCGGDSLSSEVREKYNKLIENRKLSFSVYEGYGLTEAVAVNCVNTLKHKKDNSIGYPMLGAEFKIVDENDNKVPNGTIGEICIKSDAVMIKYLNDDANTKLALRNGWLHTGDLGHIDDEGFIFFNQRQKRVVKVSGVMVFPSEIEKLVESIPGVSKCCAIQIPDDKMQHAIKIFVKAKYFDVHGMKDTILDTCRKYLIKWAVPKEIEFIEEMPVTLLGKIDFKELQKQEDKKRGII